MNGSASRRRSGPGTIGVSRGCGSQVSASVRRVARPVVWLVVLTLHARRIGSRDPASSRSGPVRTVQARFSGATSECGHPPCACRPESRNPIPRATARLGKHNTRVTRKVQQKVKFPGLEAEHFAVEHGFPLRGVHHEVAGCGPHSPARGRAGHRRRLGREGCPGPASRPAATWPSPVPPAPAW